MGFWGRIGNDCENLSRSTADCAVSRSLSDFISLLKPRVMSLALFTALVGFVIAPGSVDPFIFIAFLLCVVCGAGAAGALNMWYDADIDAVMSRTAKRPVPSGQVAPFEALALGCILAFGSVFLLGILVNWVASALLAFTIFFYLVIYTMWLKRWTAQNIVIGGIAGAFPPMIGWASATGHISLESLALFAIIFIWTPPHSWSLALFSERDYERAEVPMLPVVAGPYKTRLWIVFYSILLVPCGLLPWFMGFAGWLFAIMSFFLGMFFLFLSFRVFFCREGKVALDAAKRLFFFSIFYLFLLYATLLFEHVMGLIEFAL
ncbi:MAG: heme o synthase [Alphaproteobacteria bacterium]|nr:heme o synthase [Alphaproteobacteria bacterium]